RPNQRLLASAFLASTLSVLRCPPRSSRICTVDGSLCGARRRFYSQAPTAPPRDRRLKVKNHQCTLPLAPGPPGVNLPSSDVFSPGTGVPDVADEEAESPLIESSDVAQAESSDATTKNITAHSAKRSFIG